jgi:CheY-like chemotaxis protein
VRTLSQNLGGETPAAALTAYTAAEHRASVIRAGFQCHVAKPVGVRELASSASWPSGLEGAAEWMAGGLKSKRRFERSFSVTPH